MSLLASDTVLDTHALRLARQNWASNLAHLKRTQPDLAAILPQQLAADPDQIWLFGRDGALTTQDQPGRWWAGCSIPKLAAEALLKPLESGNLTSCYISPAYAGLLVTSLERMGRAAGLLAVVPDISTLKVILGSHDFGDEFEHGRLWFAAGEDWPHMLGKVLDRNPGLPIPSRFIRTKLTGDDVANPIISEAQRVFSQIISERAKQLDALRAADTAIDRGKILLIAPSQFRLWDFAPRALSLLSVPNHADDSDSVQRGQNGVISHFWRFDPDRPDQSSPLALAHAADGCGTVIAADVSRLDAQNLVSPKTAWITWITRPIIPPHSHACEHDRLILAEGSWKKIAKDLGWPEEKLSIACWPKWISQTAPVASPQLAIIADTMPIKVPNAIEDLSSHRVLWELIEDELKQNPFIMNLDCVAYLDSRAKQVGIDPAMIDRRKFIDLLLVPAYQQGLARTAIRTGLPIKLHGFGWTAIEEFTQHAAGPVTSFEQFKAILQQTTAILHAWPVREFHAISTVGKPVVIPSSIRPDNYVRQLSQAMHARIAPASQSDDVLPKVLDKLLTQRHGL